MRKVFSALFSPWTLRGLAAALLAWMIWFAGPLLAIADYRPLDPAWARAGLIAALLTLWAVRLILRRIRLHKGNKKFFERVFAKAADANEPPGSAQVRERFEKAVTLLKHTRFGSAPSSHWWQLGIFNRRRYAYQLPWFIFIGAPGSGKTTALSHSGLQFPFEAALGKQPLQGIGGTRHCEWWITDQAVLIDTAGRYTTQDSNAADDAAEWREFLKLLKQFRPRQPINGVLVTISVSDLLNSANSDAELNQQVTAIRTRIMELQQYLGHTFPVYLLVTKTDLLPGFMQFFEDLHREQREQIWGVTLDLNEKEHASSLAAQLRPEMAALESRLFTQVFARMQAAHDTGTRTLMFGFPSQWVQLKEVVLQFVEKAFEPSQKGTVAWLRGVYFVSGTQEGSPIDRVLGSLVRSFGIERKVLPAQKPSGKSFFITRLFRDVIFPEAALAGTSLAEEKRLKTLKWSGIAAASLALALALGMWSFSYLGNARYVGEVQANVDQFKQSLASMPATGDRLPELLKQLDAARRIATTESVNPSAPPLHMTVGLYQGDKLHAAASQAYGRLLSGQLAPMLSKRIEAGMRSQAANPELQYETLKAYLMLHQRDQLDHESLRAWVAFDLERNPPPAFRAEDIPAVLAHLDALLARDVINPGAAIDMQLVASVRHGLLQAPFVQRVYSRVRRQSNHGNLKEFRVADAAGPNGQLVFTRTSGQPLSHGVPGLFTYDGYYQAFLPQLAPVLKQLAAEEVWVLGIKDSANERRASDPASSAALADEVKRLYLQDYATMWERFLTDIALIRTQNLAQSIDQAKILSSPDSPLPRLLRAVVREVTLLEREAATPAPAKQPEALISKGKNKLEALLGQKQQEPKAAQESRIEAIVDQRFEGLRRFARSPAPNQPAPMDAAISLINDLYLLLSATESALKGGNAPPQSDVPHKLRAEAARLPEPVRSMLSGLAGTSLSQALVSTRSKLSARLMTMVTEPCQKALAGRYPFVRGSSKDVVPDDFARVLAREGVMDDFFQKNLAALVDTSSKPWRFRQLGDPSTGGDTAALAQFERAEEIRRVFFPPGSRTLNFRLELKPVSMDPSIRQFTMDVDGQLVSYVHGPAVPITVQWPGPRATNRITFEVITAKGTEPSEMFEGPWALFRMFDRAQITRAAQPERFRATFSVGGNRVVFDVTTNGVQNPFRMPELQAFQCPSRL